jgi:cytochrome P450
MSRAEAPTAVFDPFSPEFRDDPYPSYRTMREAGPVIRTPFGSLMVTRYEPVATGGVEHVRPPQEPRERLAVLTVADEAEAAFPTHFQIGTRSEPRAQDLAASRMRASLRRTRIVSSEDPSRTISDTECHGAKCSVPLDTRGPKFASVHSFPPIMFWIQTSFAVTIAVPGWTLEI